MATQTLSAIVSNLSVPDEVREFSNGRIELVHLGDVVLGKITLQPGWQWARDVKPMAGTDSCHVAHTQYVLSGRLKVVMDDGTSLELKAGDAAIIPPGHDASVIGDEPFVAIEITGAKEFAARYR